MIDVPLILAQAAGGSDPAAVATINSLPFPAHIGAILALAGGLLLWAFGRGMLRIFFVVVGTGAGATFGAFLPPALGLNIEPVYTVAAGAIIGFITSFIAFRFAIAATLATTLAIVAPIVAATVMSVHGPPPTTDAAEEGPTPTEAYLDEMRERADAFQDDLELLRDGHDLIMGAGDDAEAAAPTALDDTVEMLQRGAERIRAFLSRVWEEHGKAWWAAQPGAARFALVASVVGGALAGFALGLAVPRKGAAVVTSFGGAAIWMPAAVWLLCATPIPLEGALPAIPAAWLIAWVVISVVGTWIQWTRSKRQADKD
ncbi:MAG: hypothetical protein KDA21_06120 [Phycisphaerales bacterium]|nr:hypothetical protein [Phycisphaerales bacterium]